MKRDRESDPINEVEVTETTHSSQSSHTIQPDSSKQLSSSQTPSSSQIPSKSESDSKTITAVDYINQQNDLEKEARELMPYEPDECTYVKGELNQSVFACLTCSRDNNNTPIGVCYSCSIQCHASHELIELFSKRNFVCDCGTKRIANTPNGACKLRLRSLLNSANGGEFRPRTGSVSLGHRSFGSQSNLELPAEDIPGSNSYNQNFKGLFCSCKRPYNPLEESGNMLQCYFGFECGEDWYHENCILGFPPTSNEDQMKPNKKTSTFGENILDKLAEPGEEASLDDSFLSTRDDSDITTPIQHFPNLDDFDVFICWKCVLKFPKVFSELKTHNDIVLSALPHFNNINSNQEWEDMYKKYLSKHVDEPLAKKVKLEHDSKVSKSESEPESESFFLKHGFKQKLDHLKQSTENNQLKDFLINNEFLCKPDPIYEPRRESDQSSTGSLLDLGTEALLSLPREKAVEGLQAYDKIRSKLRDFFKPFAEEGKVVTEKEVREFFGDMKNKDN